MYIRLLVSILMGLVLFGCASTPKQSFNAEANKNIKSIALLSGKEAKKARVVIFAHPGYSFGLIGAAVAAANIHKKENEYNTAIKGLNFDWNKYIHTELKRKLEEKTYSIYTLTSDKEYDSQGLSESFPETDAAAILNYSLSVGQYSTSMKTPYIPSALLNVRMVNSQSKAILYEEQFIGGHSGYQQNDRVHITTECSYADMVALKADPQGSIDAIKIAVDKVIDRVVHDLKK